ncbi:unnamed protein product [Adineta ricciae]|uniref:Uncharacterized protein n=1 Tax=Adineta ricciae TaxID=249248 RepID=A0A813RBL4_ADIRI|nr:unnamed protein product [Adineta ricciae]CAF0818040.1 unnamed protein product [Adineta ricciae]
MCDPTGAHITRIYVNCSRQSPSPIRPSNTVPVCTSTPINNVAQPNPSPKQQMALVAKEILKAQRSTNIFVQKPDSPQKSVPVYTAKEVSPPQPSSETFIQKPESPKPEKYAFVSKGTGQKIDFTTGDGISKIAPVNTGTISKKKSRQSLAIVPPAQSNRSSKSSDDGDYLVPMTNEGMATSNEKRKTNFTSYDGVQMFTFTLDDD